MKVVYEAASAGKDSLILDPGDSFPDEPHVAGPVLGKAPSRRSVTGGENTRQR
jgi:hypothetical protein